MMGRTNLMFPLDAAQSSKTNVLSDAAGSGGMGAKTLAPGAPPPPRGSAKDFLIERKKSRKRGKYYAGAQGGRQVME